MCTQAMSSEYVEGEQLSNYELYRYEVSSFDKTSNNVESIRDPN